MWKFKTDFRVSSIPSIENGIVYFGSDDGHLYGIDIPTGDLIWKFYESAPISSSLISNSLIFYWSSGYISNGTIHASARDAGYLKILNVSNNEQLDEFRCDYVVKPYKIGEAIYFGTEHKLYSYDFNKCQMNWEIRVNGIYSIVRYDDKHILVGSQNRALLVNIDNGNVSELCRLSGYANHLKIINGKLFYIESGTVKGFDIETNNKIAEYKSNYTFYLGINKTENYLIYAHEYDLYCSEIE